MAIEDQKAPGGMTAHIEDVLGGGDHAGSGEIRAAMQREADRREALAAQSFPAGGSAGYPVKPEHDAKEGDHR
jgi:hypothetical protein